MMPQNENVSTSKRQRCSAFSHFITSQPQIAMLFICIYGLEQQRPACNREAAILQICTCKLILKTCCVFLPLLKCALRHADISAEHYQINDAVLRPG